MVVKLQMTDMYFQNRLLCRRHYIDVRDGQTNRGTRLAALCGSTVTQPVFSNGNAMYVKLVWRNSATLNQYRFQATWEAVCRKHLTAEAGTLQSPGFPGAYLTDLDCTFLIEQPRGYTIRLNFTDFSLDDLQNGNCSDYVEVYDGLSEYSPRLDGPYCGKDSPAQYESSKNVMLLKFRSDANSERGSTGFRATYVRMTPECPSSAIIDQMAPGTLTSPGFPEPFPEEAICTWTIKKKGTSNLFGITFTFHTIQLGPDTDLVLDCDSNYVKTVVSLYEGSKLLARFCKRNAFSQVIKTGAEDLRVEFRSKNLGRSAAWDQNPVHGFNASYDFYSLFGETPGSPKELKLLPYGPYTKDKQLQKTGQILDRTAYLKVENGIPIDGSRFHYFYIQQDGKVGFSKVQNDLTIITAKRLQDQCSGRRYQSVCAYCTVVDCSDGSSVVYYNLHRRGNATLENEVFPTVKESITRFKGSSDFDLETVLVVTWHKVRQGKATFGNSPKVYNGSATFQVVVAVTDDESYAIVFYEKDEMQWKFKPAVNPIIDAGFTAIQGNTRDCQDLVLSRTRKMLRIDAETGNLAQKAAWMYKLGEGPKVYGKLCDDWYYRNRRFNDIRMPKFATLPKCPCIDSWIYFYGIWIQTEDRTRLCYRLTKAASREFLPFGKECCYAGGQLITYPPDAASATAYNPGFSSLYNDYLREDRLAHEACCGNSSSSHCTKYYELRPIGECEPEPTFRLAWLCCDPHITTLDEGEYTFNGWGEYTMITLATSGLNFTLQARTDLAETETGKLSNATVFSAFGVEENRNRIFVGLDAGTKNTLVIFGNNEDFSRRFNENPDFHRDTENFLIKRNNHTFQVLFPSGIFLGVAIQEKSLAVSISIPKTFRGQTQGLLGNFNGDNTDDYILPNGTTMSADSTERQIFDNFGPAWAVTADNTVMRYGPREDFHNYTHPEFVPVFLDEQSPEIRAQARSVCGDNLACMYDYVATGSLQYALRSKAVKENADQVNILTNNSVPKIKAPSKLVVFAGKTVNFTLTGSDRDGDPITFHVEDDLNGAVQVNATTGLVQYTPTVDDPPQLRFSAKDPNARVSGSGSVAVINIGRCSASVCSGHGNCDLDSLVEVPGKTSYYECKCEHAWDGEDCENDRDGCIDNPCLEGQTCRDLTPSEQGSNAVGFDCGDCPAGFDKAPNEPYCQDIDECENSTLNGCKMICINTRGSYSCDCRAGYRLNYDGQSCGDIDECQERTDDCDHICDNTDGGYNCRCEEGYSRKESSNTCIQDADLAVDCEVLRCSQGCKRGTDPASGASVLECFCFAGYDNTTEDAAECVDHDECQDNVNVCSQGCFNLLGGFACTCHIGFERGQDQTTCLPCRDAKYGPNCHFDCNCRGRADYCDPVIGCVCQQGWRGNECQEDVDECAETPNVCGTDKLCNNTPGSYTCNCPKGYSKDENDNCVDINECDDSVLKPCGDLQDCNNVPGSFFCTCTQGYIMSNGKCVDIDECDLGISDCEHQCINVNGSFNCKCRDEYQVNTDRATCSKVIDVCAAEENLSCDQGCTLNDEGRVVCFCNIGFSLQADGQTCNRTIRCATFGCSHTCEYKNNKPQCSPCPAGKTLDADLKTCLDCPSGTFGVNCTSRCSCGLGASQCHPTEGCVCKTGWTGVRCELDENKCDDISVVRQCQDKGAVCENTPGSHRCACQKGFKMDDTGICQDINECRDDPCGQQCENSPGSYRCLCSQGFSLDSASSSCKDIDECALSTTNRCTQACINLDGSYRCACNRTGFVLSADRVSCTSSVSCNRVDCPRENGGCSEEQCFCNSGYKLSDSNTCEPTSTNSCSSAVCEQECQETPDESTPFRCSCRDGYILNDDKRTCRVKVDGVCSRTDCPTQNGGCRMEKCFCDSGYELSNSNTCQTQETGRINVTFTVDVRLRIQVSEFNNKEGSKYVTLVQDILQELKRKLHPVEAGSVDVRVTRLRIGSLNDSVWIDSLIVDADVLVDKVNTPDAMSSLAGQLQLLGKDKFVIQEQSGDVIQMTVNGIQGSSWTSCQVLQAISPCSADQLCDDGGERPVCRQKDKDTSDTADSLAVGLGVGLVLAACLIGAVVAYLIVKNRKRDERDVTASH